MILQRWKPQSVANRISRLGGWTIADFYPTPSPIPAGNAIGGTQVTGGGFQHITVTVTNAQATTGRIDIAHGLTYTPSFVTPVARGAEGVTPVLFANVLSFDATYIRMRFSDAGTWDIYYC